jgi:hypothetical protein
MSKNINKATVMAMTSVHGLTVKGEIQQKGSLFVARCPYGDNLIIEFLLSEKAPENSQFLPANVYRTEKDGKELPVWSYAWFKDEPGKWSQARFYQMPEGGIIGLIISINHPEDRKSGKKADAIFRVFPLSDLSKAIPVSRGGGIMSYLGGMKIDELIDVKVALSRKLANTYPVNNNEEKVFLRLKKEDEVAAKEQERKDRLNATRELSKQIMNRPKITVYSGEKKIYGHPATEQEWTVSQVGTPIVMVSSYDQDTGDCGDLLEAFFINDKQGRKEKGNPQINLQWEKPIDKSDISQLELTPVYAVVGARRLPFDMVDSSGLETLQQLGVNSGTKVVLDEPDNDGLYPLYTLKSNSAELDQMVPLVKV